MKNQLNDEEREKLRLENEIRKIKLSLEKGATFMDDPDTPALPPEIENDFLNYIEQFETMNENSPKLSVYDKLGRPYFQSFKEISDDQIENELHKLCDLMAQNGIAIDAIYDVDDREMYRFITEDLFEEEFYDMTQIVGMVTHFIYEEFYPNVDEDIKKSAEEFYSSFFDKSKDYYKYQISSRDNTWFEDFRNAYTDFKTKSFEILDYSYNDEGATLHFDIEFLAFLDERQTHHFKGKGIMYMDNNYWSITKVDFPKAK